MERYLITGATGYIGSMLVQHILSLEGEKRRISVLVRDKKKAEKRLPQDVEVICADIADGHAMESVKGAFDYIIHTAAVTTSSYMISHPVETADSIVLGTRNVLEFARRTGVKSMVYVSSMEVYGQVGWMDGKRAGEKDLGTIEIHHPRSCYPLGKRMAEHYCCAYWNEYDLPVKIARLAQTFGRGARKDDNRVFAQFARAVLSGEDIVLHTDGMSMGNYCAIDDAIEAMMLLLESGKNGEAYNIVNEASTMRIREMAELVAKEFSKGKISVKCQLDKNNVHGYAEKTELALSAEKMRSLGWNPTRSLLDMYQDMIYDWRNMK